MSLESQLTKLNKHLDTIVPILERLEPVLLGGATQGDAPVKSGKPTASEASSSKADPESQSEVEALAASIMRKRDQLDVLINNAGIYAPGFTTEDGFDVRFAVNTLAPFLLTRRLLPILGSSGRVINVSSAAQSTVSPSAITGPIGLSDGDAYAQSKLALIMWSRSLALSLGNDGPVIIAVNPGSLLGSKMVKEAFGLAGGDLHIGADILTRLALEDEFAAASGRYFDNDQGRFGSPHPNALDPEKCNEIVETIEKVLNGTLPKTNS